MHEPIIVFCTCSTEEEAKTIAQALVEERLAACVNIAGHVTSIYRWDGKIESAAEWLLIIKTISGQFSRLAERVKALHSYDVPEIVALPVVAGAEAYLQWIREQVNASAEQPENHGTMG